MDDRLLQKSSPIGLNKLVDYEKIILNSDWLPRCRYIIKSPTSKEKQYKTVTFALTVRKILIIFCWYPTSLFIVKPVGHACSHGFQVENPIKLHFCGEWL